jgi:hypothetical protein
MTRKLSVSLCAGTASPKIKRISQSETRFVAFNFYEFVTDQYATVGRSQLCRELFRGFLYENWVERIGVRVYGTISDENRAINASGLVYNAPENVYWEYKPEWNIFKVFRIDFAWRGNYLNTPDTQRFSVKGSFGFIFRAISSCTLYLL